MPKPKKPDLWREQHDKEQLLARSEVSDLLNVEGGLSDWEVKFIESVAKWRGDFTEKQVVTIHKVWDRLLGKEKQ